jgi:hypothetical protein
MTFPAQRHQSGGPSSPEPPPKLAKDLGGWPRWLRAPAIMLWGIVRASDSRQQPGGGVSRKSDASLWPAEEKAFRQPAGGVCGKNINVIENIA